MDNVTSKTLNPWISMWTRPRDTIRQIVDSNPEHLVLVLAAIAGFANTLNRASTKNMGDLYEWPLIFLAAAIIGPIAGIIGLYIGGALIRWAGGWMGGDASPENIRAAMAWSGVPVIWALLLWIPELLLFGQEMFTTEIQRIEDEPGLAYVLLGFAAIEITIAIWAFIIFLKCLGQVQGFSAWKALGNTLLAMLTVIVPLAMIAVGAIYLTE